MSISLDQFLQVKCKFQLTTETDSSESLRSQYEKVRLCTSATLADHSTLIVMICSNKDGNNHIVTYYIQRREYTTNSPATSIISHADNISPNISQNGNFDQLANKLASTSVSTPKSNHSRRRGGRREDNSQSTTRLRPRIIVKQIYYHPYNEDIVALSLSESGDKLALISGCMTIFILPIKNILLNLHGKQLKSSQGKSMYFYDAMLIDSVKMDNVTSCVYWTSQEAKSDILIVAGARGELRFISVQEKKQLGAGTQVPEPIKHMQIVRDRYDYTLLITGESFQQYRLALQQIRAHDLNNRSRYDAADDDDGFVCIENDSAAAAAAQRPFWDKKPIPVRQFNNTNLMSSGGHATAAIQRVLVPSSRAGHQASAFSTLQSRERAVSLVVGQAPDLMGVIDVLGPLHSPSSPSASMQSALAFKRQPTYRQRMSPEPPDAGAHKIGEPRLLRFFQSKHFYYKPQKPSVVCKLACLDANEQITQLVLTDRFIAIATDYHRCIVHSRNFCSTQAPQLAIGSAVYKEISFSNDERILLLLKSPIANDTDDIVDSFMLVTTRCIYTIEPRHSCREMFIKTIDTHLGIKRLRRSSRVAAHNAAAANEFAEFVWDQSNCADDNAHTKAAHSECVNLLINNFLTHRDDTYEKVCHDTKTFSLLFKLELNSLYEAYGDKCLFRGQFELAKRFFKLAKFDNSKSLGKYIRLLAKLRVANAEGFNSVWHRKTIRNIFMEFLDASLDESTSDDSCKLWHLYVNLHLNHVASSVGVNELEKDIMDMLDEGAKDYRVAVALFEAIAMDENGAMNSCAEQLCDKVHNLSQVFNNVFLMKLLDKTLDLVSLSI